MAVDTYALTSVDSVKSYIGSDINRDALKIYYSGAASSAYVQIDNNTLVLTHNYGTDASIDLTNVSYDTLSELVAYINASVANWEATRLYHGSASSADLLETGELGALGSSNEQTLKIEDNYLIERLVDRATDLIERYCNRKLKSRAYTKEIYDGNGFNKFILEQYPVTELTRLGMGRTNAFSVQHTTATTAAFFEITQTVVKLQTDDNAATSLTIDDYATINALITAIEANAGWDCTLLNSSCGSYDPKLVLLPRPRMYCLTPSLAYAEMVDDFLTEYHLEAGPDADRNQGIVYYPGVFINGHQNIFVWYTAGYTTVPYSLEMACIELVKWKHDRSKKDFSLRSEKIGNVYSYENFGIGDFEAFMGIHPEIRAELDLFRRREF